PFWKIISHCNPVFYMINILRHAMIGKEEASIPFAFMLIFLLLGFLLTLNWCLLKKGKGLRE
ncbi:MAG: ABC transporter permease, partial [Legionellaceae bacterium]|nr:ABC transporter permease [Legionellaceae bacterium]